MTKKNFNLEALKAIPVDEVIVALGGNYKNDRKGGSKQYNMHCCNSSFHKDGDKKPSMTIWSPKNIAKCHVCDTKGDPISIAKAMFGGDFKVACEWLHDTFSIPYMDGSVSAVKKQAPKKLKKEIEYQTFDKSISFQHIKLKDYIKKYDSLNDVQRLKLIYTFMYRFSLCTNRSKLREFYQGRGIKNNPHLDKLGFLSKEDIKILLTKMIKIFKEEDLVSFGIIHPKDHKFPLSWKSISNAVLVPHFSVYTDLVEGFMLRPVDDTNKWFNGKEMRLSTPSILKPMPFGAGYRVLNGDCDIYITEGHIDALSLPHHFCFLAAPGVQSFEKEQLGMLKGRNIKLVFDMDDAGQKAAWGYTEISYQGQELVVLNNELDGLDGMIKFLKKQEIEVKTRRVDGFRDQLLKAGVASVEIVSWDNSFGKDVNEVLLQNGTIEGII